MRWFVLVWVWIFSGAVLAQGAADKLKPGPVPDWVKPQPIADSVAPQRGLGLGFNSVIELLDTQYRADGPASERYQREVVRIQQAAALQYWGSLRIGFVPDYQQVRVHEVAILRGSQRIDVRDQLSYSVSVVEPLLEQLQITGRAVAVAQIPDLRVNDRLVVAYTVLGQNPVFGNSFSANIGWNGGTLIEQRSVRLLHRASQPVRSALVGDALGMSPQPMRNTVGDWQELVWKQAQLMPPAPERGLPRGYFPGSSLVISSFADWRAVQAWGASLFDLAPNAEVQALARSWRKTGEPLRQAVAQAVRFVQDDVRYFSVSVADNSHRPRAPHETLARRYGDCKDKSVLLVALLRSLGITANTVLVSQTERRWAERYGPTPLAFDHAVVRFTLDGKEWVVDPTRLSRGLAFDAQSNEQLGNLGLDLVAAGEGQLLPMGSIEPVRTTESEIEVIATGMAAPAEFRIVSRYLNAAAEIVRDTEAEQTRSAREEAMLKRFRSIYPNAQAVAGYPVVRDDKTNNTYTVEERYKVDELMRKENQQNLWFAAFGANALISFVGPAQIDKRRSLPLGLAQPYSSHRYSVTVTFPPNITGLEDPSTDNVTTPHYELRTARSFRGNVFSFSSEIRVRRDAVMPAEMDAFAKSMEALGKKPMDIVVLSPRNMVDASQAAKPLGARLREEYQKVEAQTTELISAAKLTDADLAAAYSERASARLTLGNIEGAATDLAQASKLAPRSAEVLLTRANLSIRQGRFTQAVAEASRALTAGSDASFAYLERGQAKWLAGDARGALDDLLQAEKVSTSGQTVGFMKIWQALARLQLKQDLGPLPDLGNQWPSPILRMIWASAKSPATFEAAYDEALRESRTANADETIKNACEVHFYAALLARIGGNNARYTELLRQTVATDVIYYTEYALAQALLGTNR